MWSVKGSDIRMTEGDWGMTLPIIVTGAVLDASDECVFKVKNAVNGTTLVTKTYSSLSNNTVPLQLSSADSAALRVGDYVWSLDWYQSGAFNCNIVPNAKFKVVEKA